MTREAAGEAAYAAGEYAAALTEFKALRRMNGSDDYLAAMADCERALGNPDRALKTVKEALANGPDFTSRVELRLVEAGARMDLGQQDEALRLLRQELEAAGGRGTRAARARLRYGYANLLEETGDTEGAERWFAAAAAMDPEGETDAAERVERLQGIVLEIDEDDLVGDEPIEGPDSDESDEDAEGEADVDEDDLTQDEDDFDDEEADDESDDADDDESDDDDLDDSEDEALDDDFADPDDARDLAELDREDDGDDPGAAEGADVDEAAAGQDGDAEDPATGDDGADEQGDEAEDAEQ